MELRNTEENISRLANRYKQLCSLQVIRRQTSGTEEDVTIDRIHDIPALMTWEESLNQMNAVAVRVSDGEHENGTGKDGDNSSNEASNEARNEASNEAMTTAISVNDLFRSLEDIRDSILAMEQTVEKFSARMVMKDPITNKPR